MHHYLAVIKECAAGEEAAVEDGGVDDVDALRPELLEQPLGGGAVRVGRDGAGEHGPVQPHVVRDPVDRRDVL